MTPFWNHILVAATVLAALGYFVWQAFARRGKGASSCGGGCGCTEKKAARPVD